MAEFLRNDYRKRSEGEVIADTRMEEKVAILKIYPGISGELLDFLVDKGYKGVVIEGTGLGHVPQDFIPHVQRAVEEGVAVCGASTAG